MGKSVDIRAEWNLKQLEWLAFIRNIAWIFVEAGTRGQQAGHLIFRTLAGIGPLAILLWGGVILAQETSGGSVSLPAGTMQNGAAPCVQPAPMVRWQDYQGKFNKVVGAFARKIERKSVRAPHYKPGALLCTLEPKDKLILFLQDTYDPVTFVFAGFNAGLDQASNRDPTFGQGAEGYGKRFGAAMAGATSSLFFKDFAYPTLFSEDPRYYRLGDGGGEKRFFHALGHAFVAHREDGTHIFNFSEWLGTSSAVALSNLYHPGNERGFGPAAGRVGYWVLTDMGFDVLREFWPEIARKLKLPFRGIHEPESDEPHPVSR